MRIRLGTRGSDLALWQAHHVKERLADEAEVEIVVIKTRGDVIDDVPLIQVEGKSFFTTEIEQALRAGEIDLAVHSHKDLETADPEGLVIAAVPERADPAEWLLMRRAAHRSEAPLLPIADGATVGTSAPRRQRQLLALRPDLQVADLRGNVPTRVQRLREGRYDAIVLAAAGLTRLGLDLSDLVVAPLPLAGFVPAPAQGALGLQVRADHEELIALLRRRLHDLDTARAIEAERSLLGRAGGGCHLPLGAHVRPAGEGFEALAFLGADQPEDGAPDRWATGRGEAPQQAVDAAWARLLDGAAAGGGPLAGLTVALVGSSDGGSLLGERLAALGATVHHEQVLSFADVPCPDLQERLNGVQSGDVIAVTSKQAALRLVRHPVPAGAVVAAVGPATARALTEGGWPASVVGDGGAAELAASLDVGAGLPVLFACAEGAREDLPRALEARGCDVTTLVLYRTVAADNPAPPQPADVRVYMSPSAVAASAAIDRLHTDDDTVHVGLGLASCEALHDDGVPHLSPDGSGPAAVVGLLARLHADRRGEPTP